MASRLLLKGTLGYIKPSISDIMESKGMEVSSFSGYNSFGVTVSAPSALAKEALSYLKDIITRPAFTKESIESQKRIINGIFLENKSMPLNVATEAFRRLYFGNHPYRWISIGSQEYTAGISQEEIAAWHAAMCNPSNMVLTLSGNIQREQAAAFAQDVFGNIKNKPGGFSFDHKTLPAASVKQAQETALQIPGLKQSILLAGFPAPDIYSQDRHVFSILESMFSDQSSALYLQIREKLGAAYSLGAFYLKGLNDASFVFYVMAPEKYLSTCMDVINAEAASLREKGPSLESFKTAQIKTLSDYLFSIQTPQALGMTVSLDELYGLGYLSHTSFEKEILSITPEKVRECARLYFDAKKQYVIKVTASDSNERKGP